MVGRILIVEGSEQLLSSSARQLEQHGYEVDLAFSLPKAAELFTISGHAIVIIDLLMAEQEVKAVIGGMLGAKPGTRIIVTTASGSMKQASDAMKLGAFDFIVKPYDSHRILHIVNNAALPPDRDQQGEAPAEPSRGYPALDAAVHRMVAQVAPSLVPVLITGPKGVMKESVARLIHAKSSLRDREFVALDCKRGKASEFHERLPSDLVRAGGTAFLNDICDLSLKIQTQLLWYLQTGLVKDAQGEAHRADIRIICGTSLKPQAAMEAGRLREDLYYRLSIAVLEVPGLNGGRFSVSVIAQELFGAYSRAIGHGDLELGAEVRDMFEHYSWPGQQAELLKLLRSVADTAPIGVVTPAHLPRSFIKAFREDQTATTRSRQDEGTGTQGQSHVYEGALRGLIRDGLTLSEIEKIVVELTIRHYQGSIPRAAAHLDVSPSTLYRKLENWAKG